MRINARLNLALPLLTALAICLIATTRLAAAAEGKPRGGMLILSGQNIYTGSPTVVPLSSLHLGLDPSPWNLPRADRAANGKPMQIKNKKYEKGIGTRAGTSYFINLGGAQRLTAEVGIDDQTMPPAQRKAQFLVLGDDKVLFDSGILQADQPPKPLDVKLDGVKVLELRVVDHAIGLPPALVDWIDATLQVEGEKPQAIPHQETAEILTPKPGPKPRINGARVFGVRPGSPFLFTIAATGEKPITFAAENLPEGLSLNAETGVISGTIADRRPDTYEAKLTAHNAQGEASRGLKIVVGSQIALTPPMGWNSWNCYAATVDQEKVLATAKAMVAKGLKDHGWTYVNIDDAWQGSRGGPFNAIQGNEKFPDMKGLCDEVHALGLKVGIYSTPWVTSYAKYIGGSSDDKSGDVERAQNKCGKYSFATNDARQWAAWGIDYLKYDWRPLDIPHVQEMANALRASGRDIVYSLSNTALYEHAGAVRTAGQLLADHRRHPRRVGPGRSLGREFSARNPRHHCLQRLLAAFHRPGALQRPRHARASARSAGASFARPT